jgi:hypothetical protein
MQVKKRPSIYQSSFDILKYVPHSMLSLFCSKPSILKGRVRTVLIKQSNLHIALGAVMVMIGLFLMAANCLAQGNA